MKILRGIVTVANARAILRINSSGFIPIKTETKTLDDGYKLTTVAYYPLTKELNDYINGLSEFKTIRFKFQKGNDDTEYNLHSIFNEDDEVTYS